ncbi:MAG: hypothetical protein V3R93_01940, partial [Candidatus Hydrothermarchaeaceae archaeon]
MKRLIALLACLMIISGCIGGKVHNIKLTSEVKPSKVSLDNLELISIDVRATNIGTSLEKISAEVIKTEGLVIIPPNRTTFTLKPGESRTIIFYANLMEDAVPGDYIIDIQIKTEAGDIIWDRAKIRVV